MSCVLSFLFVRSCCWRWRSLSRTVAEGQIAQLMHEWIYSSFIHHSFFLFIIYHLSLQLQMARSSKKCEKNEKEALKKLKKVRRSSPGHFEDPESWRTFPLEVEKVQDQHNMRWYNERFTGALAFPKQKKGNSGSSHLIFHLIDIISFLPRFLFCLSFTFWKKKTQGHRDR